MDLDAILELGLSNAVIAAGLAAVIVPLCWRFRCRPAVVHLLWVSVLIKLVVPGLWQVPMPTWSGDRPDGLATASEPIPIVASVETHEVVSLMGIDAEMGLDELPEFGSASDWTDLGTSSLVFRGDPPEIRELRSTRESPTWPGFIGLFMLNLPWLKIVFGLWLAGTLVYAGVTIRRIQRFGRLLAEESTSSNEAQRELAWVARRFDLRDCPEVRLVPGELSPALWALGHRALIIIPKGLWGRLDPDQRRTLLAHELAHWKRGDHWVRALELLATGLFWWHPVVYWTRTRLRGAEEACCDAWVIRVLPKLAKAYATTLVETVDFMAQGRDRSGGLPVGASGLGQVHHLSERIPQIMSRSQTRRLGWGARLGLLSLTLGLVPLMPSLAQEQSTKKTGEAQVFRFDLTSEIQGDQKTPAQPKVLILRTDEQGQQKVQVLRGEGQGDSGKTPGVIVLRPEADGQQSQPTITIQGLPDSASFSDQAKSSKTENATIYLRGAGGMILESLGENKAGRTIRLESLNLKGDTFQVVEGQGDREGDQSDTSKDERIQRLPVQLSLKVQGDQVDIDVSKILKQVSQGLKRAKLDEATRKKVVEQVEAALKQVAKPGQADGETDQVEPAQAKPGQTTAAFKILVKDLDKLQEDVDEQIGLLATKANANPSDENRARPAEDSKGVSKDDQGKSQMTTSVQDILEGSPQVIRIPASDQKTIVSGFLILDADRNSGQTEDDAKDKKIEFLLKADAPESAATKETESGQVKVMILGERTGLKVEDRVEGKVQEEGSTKTDADQTQTIKTIELDLNLNTDGQTTGTDKSKDGHRYQIKRILVPSNRERMYQIKKSDQDSKRADVEALAQAARSALAQAKASESAARDRAKALAEAAQQQAVKAQQDLVAIQGEAARMAWSRAIEELKARAEAARAQSDMATAEVKQTVQQIKALEDQEGSEPQRRQAQAQLELAKMRLELARSQVANIEQQIQVFANQLTKLQPGNKAESPAREDRISQLEREVQKLREEIEKLRKSKRQKDDGDGPGSLSLAEDEDRLLRILEAVSIGRYMLGQ